jgi:hypothetical protein
MANLLQTCAATCLCSPIVCATNYIKVGASGSFICQAASGDLEIKSAGGDLDITTWVRMRAATNSTIKSSWSHSTGHMHLRYLLLYAYDQLNDSKNF